MTEKEKKLSREDVAKMEIGHTEISKNTAVFICILFLTLIVGYPVLQLAYEVFYTKRKLPQSFDIFFNLPKSLSHNGRNDLISANGRLLSEINRYEDDLEENALLRKYLLPSAQKTLLDIFKVGNEKVFVGKDGFIFFQAGIKYLTNPGFLSTDALKKRIGETGIQPDPRKAIIQFKKQLAKRNIKLIIVPTTVKPMIYPDKISSAFNDFSAYLQNPSFIKFKQDMEQAGVLVFDPAPVLADARKKNKDVFLKTDTHWTPYGMEQVAKELKNFIDSRVKLSAKIKTNYSLNRHEIAGLGDIALMLKLHNPETRFAKQKVEIKEVFQGKNIFHCNPDSEILLLGDSFTNIFSLKAMGWGENAGFGEYIAFRLKRRIDIISRNDAGAYATREILDNQLKKGHDRLAGKKLVIWQFAIRELLDGDWKLFEMKPGIPKTQSFFVPQANAPVIIKAKVVDVSLVPRPGLVPYKDHIMSLHLTDVNLKNQQALVYIQSMKDAKLTPAAKLRSNQEIRIKLFNWQDVENQYSRFNRSDLANDDIALENPCWGELINEK